MTELDAYAVSRIDQDDLARRAKAAKSPSDIAKMTEAFLLHRLRGLEGGPDAIPFAQEAFAHHRGAASATRALVFAVEGVLKGLRERLEPEDLRAWMLYLVGAQGVGAGLFQFALSLIRDADMRAGAERVQALVETIRKEMDAEDQALFGPEGAVKGLPIGLREWVTSLLDEARVAFREKDGEMGRGAVVRARDLVRAFTA